MADTLGTYLRMLREEAGKSLRDVEAKCKISNGYVSLLEHDKVKEPSPKMLYNLAVCYGVDYLELMRRAGYPVPASGEQTPAPGVVFRGAERLSEPDKEEIQEIIRLKLRRQKQRNRE